MRVRFEKGWTSTKARTGKRMLRRENKEAIDNNAMDAVEQNAVYSAKLKGVGKVEVCAAAMGLQVYEGGKPVPTTHLYQKLKKWEVSASDGTLEVILGDDTLLKFSFIRGSDAEVLTHRMRNNATELVAEMKKAKKAASARTSFLAPALASMDDPKQSVQKEKKEALKLEDGTSPEEIYAESGDEASEPSGEPSASEPVEYVVLAAATVRKGQGSTTEKVGEHSKGRVIRVIRVSVNSDGLAVMETITEPAGWVKLKTSKGKLLLERLLPGVNDMKVSSPKKAAPLQPQPSRKVMRQASADAGRYQIKQADGGKVEVAVESTGLYVFTKGALVPEIHLYEQLSGWRAASEGFQLSYADNGSVLTFSCSNKQVKAIMEAMNSSALELAAATKQKRRAEKAAREAASEENDTSEDDDSSASECHPSPTNSVVQAVEAYEETDAADDDAEEVDEDVAAGAPVDDPIRYKVLAGATVRTGPEGSSDKVGEHSKGDIIDVVQEATNADGLTVMQTITAPSGSQRGGWIKLKTSKGKVLLERLNADAGRTYSAKCGSKKVQLQIGSMGLQVLYASSDRVTILYKEMMTWESDEDNDILLVIRTDGREERFKMLPAGKEVATQVAKGMRDVAAQLAQVMAAEHDAAVTVQKTKRLSGFTPDESDDDEEDEVTVAAAAPEFESLSTTPKPLSRSSSSPSPRRRGSIDYGAIGSGEDAALISGNYKALCKAAVRADFEMDSERVGFLGAGDVIAVLEARNAFMLPGARVRCLMGWTSTAAPSGSRMLEATTEPATVTGQPTIGPGLVKQEQAWVQEEQAKAALAERAREAADKVHEQERETDAAAHAKSLARLEAASKAELDRVRAEAAEEKARMTAEIDEARAKIQEERANAKAKSKAEKQTKKVQAEMEKALARLVKQQAEVTGSAEMLAMVEAANSQLLDRVRREAANEREELAAELEATRMEMQVEQAKVEAEREHAKDAVEGAAAAAAAAEKQARVDAAAEAKKETEAAAVKAAAEAQSSLCEAAKHADMLQVKYTSEQIAQRREGEEVAAALAAEREERAKLEVQLAEQARSGMALQVEAATAALEAVKARAEADGTTSLSAEASAQLITESAVAARAQTELQAAAAAAEMQAEYLAQMERQSAEMKQQQEAFAAEQHRREEDLVQTMRTEMTQQMAQQVEAAAEQRRSVEAELTEQKHQQGQQQQQAAAWELEQLETQSKAFAAAVEQEAATERARLAALVEMEVASLKQMRVKAEALQRRTEEQAEATAQQLRQKAARTEAALLVDHQWEQELTVRTEAALLVARHREEALAEATSRRRVVAIAAQPAARPLPPRSGEAASPLNDVSWHSSRRGSWTASEGAESPPRPSAEEGTPPPLLEPSLRPAGYREDVLAEVDEPVSGWLDTIKLPKAVAPAMEAGLRVLDDVIEMDEDEVVALCAAACLTTAEGRRLRRELRVLRRGGAAVREMFAPPKRGSERMSPRTARRQPYAKPDDVLDVGGEEHRVWVSPFVKAGGGGEEAVEGEVRRVATVLRQRR